MIRVVVIDDHPIILDGLKNTLNESKRLQVCNTYSLGAEALAHIGDDRPDIILLDMLLPDYEGEEMAEALFKILPEVRILVLSSIDVPARVRKMIQAGCSGYLLKNVSKETIMDAIERVHQGEEVVQQSLKQELLDELLHPGSARPAQPRITRREKEILELLAEGNTSQQIADRLFLSIRTVENHRKSLLHKFKVRNTVVLLKSAAKSGLIR